MLSAEGIKVTPNSQIGKSRHDLIAERRQQKSADAAHWNNLQQQQRQEHKMKRLNIESVLCAKKKSNNNNQQQQQGGASKVPQRPATARVEAHPKPPNSSDKITSSPEKQQQYRDDPAVGVKRIEGRSGAQCETYFKDYSSKKTFDAKAAHSPGMFGNGPINEQQNTQFIHVVKDTYTRPLSARTPGKYDVSGKVCASDQQWKATGINQPMFLPVPMQAKLRRPEITALDSFKIPIYSCFSRDRKFQPRIDDAFREIKKRREYQQKVKMEKVKMRMTNQKIAVAQFRMEGEHQEDLKAAGLIGGAEFVSPRMEAISPDNVEAAFDPHKQIQQNLKNRSAADAAHPHFSTAAGFGGHHHRNRAASITITSPEGSRRNSPHRGEEQGTPQRGLASPSSTNSPCDHTPPRVPQRPPTHHSGIKVRPHTAGASRTLQHSVKAHTVADVTDAAQLEHISGPISAQTVAAPTATNAVRPHSAKPVSSPRMAMELGGLDALCAVSRGGASVGLASTDIAYSTLTGGRSAATTMGALKAVTSSTRDDGAAPTPSSSMTSLLTTLLNGDQARRQRAPSSNVSATTQPSVFRARPNSGRKKVTVLEQAALEDSGKLDAGRRSADDKEAGDGIIEDDGPAPTGPAGGDVSGWFPSSGSATKY